MVKCKQKVLKSSQNIIKVSVSIVKLYHRENNNVFAPEFGFVIVSIGHLAAHDPIFSLHKRFRCYHSLHNNIQE